MKTLLNTKERRLLNANLRLFANPNTQVTTQQSLSDEMKVFYSDYLIDMAGPKLVHDQFGQKHPIPKNGGKTIEFRKYSKLAKALTPLTEGVTPDGNSLSVTTLEATIDQYGDYVTLSDVLLLTAIDNNLVQATKLLGKQAGETLDTITREELMGGSVVQYGENAVSARHLLVGGESTGNHYLTVDAVRMAVRTLKLQNAERIDDSYVAVIHPDVSYDLMSDPAWVNVKTYSDPEGIYAGEIGRLAGVRFVETTEAKVFKAKNLTAAARNLTVKTAIAAPTKTVAVKEAITADEATALAGRAILIGGSRHKIASATAGAADAASLTLAADIAEAAANAVIYPGEAGAKGRNVYATLILGENAYGVTEVAGGGLQHIIKQLGSGEDPLNQRATAGWKAMKVAKRLIEEYMVRVETASVFSDTSDN